MQRASSHFRRPAGLTVLTLLAALVAGCAQGDPGGDAAAAVPSEPPPCAGHVMPNQHRDSDTVRRLDLSWGEHWRAGDLVFLDCLYDPIWHYVTPKGIVDKAKDLAQAADLARKHPQRKDSGRIVSLQVFTKGDFAASTGLYRGATGSRSRWTDYFQWNGTRWVAVFSQATPVGK